MSGFDFLILIFSITLIVCSVFNTYERASLLAQRKYHSKAYSLLPSQYMADGLVLFKYLCIMLYGAEMLCLTLYPSSCFLFAFLTNAFVLLFFIVHAIVHEKYGLNNLYNNLKEKWKDGVNYDTYEDEVNVYRAIRDSGNFILLTIVGFIQLVVLLSKI